MLALIEKELSFFWIGVLYSCRSLTLNLSEVFSGAIADQWGRRRSMMLSFVAYILSFLCFGFSSSVPALCLAMVLYGIGDSFRTGTHKAIIFHWLKLEGRAEERTRVYGTTRSWSKYGSAVAAILGAVILLSLRSYEALFLVAIVPCFANLINFWSYPSELESEVTSERIPAGDSISSAPARNTPPQSPSFRSRISKPFSALGSTMSALRSSAHLRQLVVESMTWNGTFESVKDYLQPALLALVTLMVVQDNSDTTAPASILTVAGTYALLNIASGLVSKQAGNFQNWVGSAAKASGRIWIGTLTIYLGLMLSCLASHWFELLSFVAVACLVLLLILQNLWRPILVSRFDEASKSEFGATLLSVESQSQRLTAFFLAPLLGFAVDLASQSATQMSSSSVSTFGLFPLGCAGLLMSATMLLVQKGQETRVTQEQKN